MSPHASLHGFMPLLLLALMWSHFSGFVHAQSAAATSTVAASAAATSTTAAAAVSTTPAATSTSVASTTAAATTTYTGKPYLVIHDVETMTACGLGQIYWNVYNEDASKVNITVYAINEGVDQTVPSASTTAAAVATSAASSAAASSAAGTSAPATSAAATSAAAAATSAAATSAVSAAAAAAVSARSLSSRSLLSINASIITQYANHGYGWDPVLLPAGRYYIWGYVDDGFGTSNRSNVFTVVEGSNTSCLAAFASQSKTASLATGSAASTGKSASVSSTAAAGGASAHTDEKSNGLSGGAIAGVVIGVLAGVAALAILALVCLRRRRRQRGYSSENPPPMGMTHRRMLSGSTAPSDPGHGTTSSHGTAAGPGGKGPIPMGTIRRDESWNSSIAKPRGSSTDSFGHNPDATPVMLGSSGGSRGEKEDGQEVLRADVRGEDPFLTPTMPPPGEGSGLDKPQRSSGYSNYPLYASFDRRASNPMPPPPPPAAITSSTSTGRSRSSSNGDPSRGERPARRTPPGSAGTSPNPGGNGGAQVGRTPSTRRKPVPSLGPELRGQLEKESSAGRVVPAMPAGDAAGARTGTGAGAGLGLGIPSDVGGNGERRISYQLMPDLPLPQD